MFEMVTGMGYIGTEPGTLYSLSGQGETVTETGSEVVLHNATKIKSIEISGKSVQEQGSKNLLDYESLKNYSNWIVATSVYKSFKITGFKIGTTYTFAMDCIRLAGYGFYCGISHVINSSAYMEWFYHSDNLSLFRKVFTFVATAETLYVNARTIDKSTINDFVDKFKDMRIYEGAYTADTVQAYEPYQFKPSPEHASEIKSVGMRTKNLLNVDTSKDVFLSNGTTEISTTVSKTTDYIAVRQGTTYVLSYDYDTLLTMICRRVDIYDTSKRHSNYTTYAVENKKFVYSAEADGYIRLNYVANAFDVQLEENSVVTAYEQFGYKTELCISKSSTLSTETKWTIGSGSYAYLKMFELANSKVSITIKDRNNGINVNGLYLGVSQTVDASTGKQWIIAAGSLLTSKINTELKYMIVLPKTQDAIDRLLKRFEVTVEIVTSDTPQTIQIYHKEQLRGISDIKDRIMCKNGVWGVERNFIDFVYPDKNGNYGSAMYDCVMSTCRFINPGYAFLSVVGIDNGEKCNKLLRKLFSIWDKDIAENVFTVNNNQLYVRLLNNLTSILESDNATIRTQKMRAYLSANNFKFILRLATPIWEPLPAQTQDELNNIKIDNQTTYITTTDPLQPEIAVKYKRRK